MVTGLTDEDNTMLDIKIHVRLPYVAVIFVTNWVGISTIISNKAKCSHGDSLAQTTDAVKLMGCSLSPTGSTSFSRQQLNRREFP